MQRLGLPYPIDEERNPKVRYMRYGQNNYGESHESKKTPY
jgi:hypothetical protein